MHNKGHVPVRKFSFRKTVDHSGVKIAVSLPSRVDLPALFVLFAVSHSARRIFPVQHPCGPSRSHSTSRRLMAPPRKSRRIASEDAAKARDDSEPEKPSEAVQEAPESQEAERSSSHTSEASNPQLETPAASNLRPLTRSLTGIASKPRARDDSWYEAPKKNPAGRKRAPPKPSLKRTIDEVNSQDKDEAEAGEPQSPPPVPETAVPPLNSTQAEFVDAAVAAAGAASVPPEPEPPRTGRSRTNLPVPVPNLIKKSRGRRVPIITNGAAPPDPEQNKRMHVCKVEGCGKCFHRGEHLKRHIRSIHTHEKPFPCTFPSCNKFFNRHDNLLQHIKVHRPNENDDAEGSPSPDGDSRPASPSNSTSAHYSGNTAALALAAALAQRSMTMGTITYPTFGSPVVSFSVGGAQPASSYAAVSSLRTELPDSPTKPGPPACDYAVSGPEARQQGPGDQEAEQQQQQQQQQSYIFAQPHTGESYMGGHGHGHGEPAGYAQAAFAVSSGQTNGHAPAPQAIYQLRTVPSAEASAVATF
ncbi:hypothetical protein GGX14DRAFT_618752 [Mycena pura]|uniref:C2H2-type domain-containing protein n=1 Tax=Mycena pura TaxID=153505 RepID=A0AAD6VLZ5_9AGAR|nr:hypothetical protein GGX14DRAFT_618752 [Mycena pura]